MPKSKFTRKDIEKLLAKSRKNQKKDFFGFGGVSERLQKRLRDWANLKANKKTPSNDDLKVNKRGIVTVSNNKNIETEVFVDGKREYYDKKSFRNTFDTEVVQLISPKPTPTPEPDPSPPPAPVDIRINCLNHHWTLNGKKGRTEKDKPSWHHNHHPLGNNPGGGYLVIPDDHPLFYLRTCEPKSARSSFNYEWKVDGEVVSNEPAFHMYNASDQEPEDDKFQNADDIIIECRVWNESGEMKAKVPMRCARNIGSSAHREDDGTPKPKWKWEGIRYFKEDKFFEGHWKCYTDKEVDPAYKPRRIRLVNIKFEDFNTDVKTAPHKYNPRPWEDGQKVASLDLTGKEVDDLDRYDNNNPYHKGHNHKTNLVKRMQSDIVKKIRSKFGSTVSKRGKWFTDPECLKGEIHINNKWVSLKDFWSGIPVKDPYDITNFMKKDENGNYDRDGDSECDKHKKWIQFQCKPGEMKTIRFKWGFAYDVKGEKLTYWLYGANWDFTVKPSDKPKLYPRRTMKHIELNYYQDLPPKKTEEKEKFTKSEAKTESKSKKRKSWYNKVKGY
mgnify:CR=1 FL=1